MADEQKSAAVEQGEGDAPFNKYAQNQLSANGVAR
jgi:hypothetical protein